MYVQFEHTSAYIFFILLPQLFLTLLLVRLHFDLIGQVHNTCFSSTVANHHSFFLFFSSSSLPCSSVGKTSYPGLLDGGKIIIID